MTVIMYASGDSSPLVSPDVNPEIDLSTGGGPLPVTSIQLYGNGTDSTDASPTWVYTWELLAVPTGSTASLSSTSAQNPTLNGVDLWGNYLIYLKGVNSNNAAASPVDPIQSESVSFVTVEVKSSIQALRKVAPGQRDWVTVLHDLASAVETMGAAPLLSPVHEFATTPVAVLTSHRYILLRNSAPMTVNLPVGVAGQVFAIKDKGGNAGTWPITIVPNGAETIDSAATYAFNAAFKSIELVFSGSDWSVI
jgi:hypothetical protein